MESSKMHSFAGNQAFFREIVAALTDDETLTGKKEFYSTAA
jgi:hypothetical protein